MQAIAEILTPILSIVVTLLLGLFGQLLRQRRQLGLADSDPVQFALKRLIEQFQTQNESLFVMSILSKFIKSLMKYISILYLNGEEVVVCELEELTKLLNARILIAESHHAGKRELTEDEILILTEIKSVLDRRTEEWQKKKKTAYSAGT